MNSHGVEISIAGGVGEMVREPKLLPVFFSFFFFYQVLCLLSRYKDLVQRELWQRKTSVSTSYRPREKAIIPSPSGMEPTARQPPRRNKYKY